MADVTTLANAAHTHLTTLNLPASTQQQIHAANTTLAGLTGSLTPATALQLSEHLLSQLLTNPSSASTLLPTIHYAFHILDVHLLNSAQPWTSFPDDIRTSLRTLCTTVITRLTPAYPALMISKASILLSSLALREWPQRWPEFLDCLLADSAPMAIACKVLRNLSDEIHEFSDRIQPARRQELRHALALTLPQTLRYVTTAVQVAHNGGDTLVLHDALECLASFVRWADLLVLFEASVPTACITLLSHDDMRDAAIDALDTLVLRQFPSNKTVTDEGKPIPQNLSFRHMIFPAFLRFVDANPAVLAFVPFALVPPAGTFQPLVNAAAQPPNFDMLSAEGLMFYVKFFGVMAQLGATHFVTSYLIDRKMEAVNLSEEDAMYAAAFIDVMAVVLSVPSVELRFAVLPFFTAVMSSLAKQIDVIGLGNNRVVSFLATAFLQSASAAMIKFPDDGVAAHFQELVEDDEAHVVQPSSVFARLISAFAIAGKLAPQRASVLALERLLGLITSVPETIEDNATGKSTSTAGVAGARQRGIIVPDGSQHGWRFGSFDGKPVAVWRACIDATCTLVEGVGGGVVSSKNGQAHDDMVVLMRRVFDIAHPLTAQSFQPAKPHVLRVLHPLYVREDRVRAACVTTLLGMAMSESTSGGRSGMRAKWLAALSSVMRRLCNSGVGGIAMFAVELCKLATGVVVSRDFPALEKVNLMESALASVMALSDLPLQMKCVESVFDPLLKALLSDVATKALASSASLLAFLEQGAPKEVAHFCEAFLMVEAGMHQIVRPVSKSNAAIVLPSMLSRSIAPSAVQIACRLVTCLHGMYDLVAEEGARKEALLGMLQPTSREVAHLLNLDTLEFIPKDVGDLIVSGQEAGARCSAGEQRSADVLLANGVTPADERFTGVREGLRNLRRAASEIIRAAIYSGATMSDLHLRGIIIAICGSCDRIEPYHLQLIMTRIVSPLLSFPVCADGGKFLDAAAHEGLPRLLRFVKDQIVRAQFGVQIFSETRLLDLSRDHGRQMLARCAADVLCAAYPRPYTAEEKSARKEGMKFVPPVFRVQGLGEEVLNLWCAVCDAGGGKLEHGPARIGLTLVTSAIEFASDGDFAFFERLLTCALRTAVVGFGGMAEESASAAAIGAVTSVMKRWPVESVNALKQSVGREREDIGVWVQECVSEISALMDKNSASKVKKHRQLVRGLVEKIAKVEGLEGKVLTTVYVLPEKLKKSSASGPRAAARRKNAKMAEDLELPDFALDSLFGEGDPL